ncbi:MAG: hypothetical protein ACREAN_07965, partial [Nitrosopumilaceae archaeon]
MRKAFYAQGLWWVVYTDGVNMVYSTSSTGLTWSSPILFLSGANNGRDLSVYATDQYVYYVTPTSKGFGYRYGLLSPKGTIFWSTSQIPQSTKYPNGHIPTVTLDSLGNIWVALRTSNSSVYAFGEVWKYASGSWKSMALINPQTNSPAWDIAIQPTASGVVVAYDNPN